jgi:hypothetical protein
MLGFPGASEAVLKLDARFLVRQGFPLLRIRQQQNQMVGAGRARVAGGRMGALCW